MKIRDNRKGMLRLRWTHQGREYSMAMSLPDTPINRAAAEAKAAKIQIDIALEKFDSTLRKYQLSIQKKALDAELFTKFAEWKQDNGMSESASISRHRSLKNHLAKFGPVATVADADGLMKQVRTGRKLSGNQALYIYREFAKWAVARGFIDKNIFASLPLIKASRTTRKSRRPFTSDEIKRLLSQFATDKKLSHYYDFVLFLFALGVRPSEAVGLRWKSVDLEKKQVTISEAVIYVNSTSRPTRKGTKNGVIRTLKLTDSVASMLSQRKKPDQAPNDPVFRAPRGGYICPATFQQRYWKPACEKAGVPYRPPYTMRHTLISHGLESEGWSLPQAAQVAGDTVSTVAKHYAHPIEPPKMPEFE